MRIRPRQDLKGLLLATLLLSAGAQADEVPPLKPIPQLDVALYMGHWYEIAKFPNRFQRKCVADTSAEYRLLDDQRIKVINRCRLSDGNMDEAIGIARQAGDLPSQLKVRFAPAWLGFLPFIWGDYWVIDLDPAYQLAAISEPKREYLWILSRTPRITPDTYAAMIRRLESMGLDTGKLQMSLQTEATR